MSSSESVSTKDGIIKFSANGELNNYLKEHQDLRAKIHASDEANTSITYNNNFFLRMYRKIDIGINPDLEITRLLSQELKFKYTPVFTGAIEWKSSKGTIVLGMMQLMIENHGDGRDYMLERINNYIERILARDRQTLHPEERMGSWTNPVSSDELPEELKSLLGVPASDQAALLGRRTAEMHLALASAHHLKEFAPEDFSLHYQRSLFASMQSLVRESYQGLYKNLSKVPETVKPQIEELLSKRDAVLHTLKKIYAKKLDVIKIRIHGNFDLEDVLLTGKDIAIQDFGGDPSRSYSERRLKRSPLRDVAGMIRSLHYVAYEGFLRTNYVQKEVIPGLLPFADLWAFYMSSFFIKAYLDTIKGSSIVPNDPGEFEIMLQTYLLEKAIFDLNNEANIRPAYVIVPMAIIKSIIK
jgi:maltose alpha-D-glucosyltransferase/alpha-amylase